MTMSTLAITSLLLFNAITLLISAEPSIAATATEFHEKEIGTCSRPDTCAGDVRDHQEIDHVDLAKLEEKRYNLLKELRGEKIDFSSKWTNIIMSYIPSIEAYKSMIGTSEIGNSDHMDVDDLSSFIISLCWLSGEASGDNIANGRCVPFDRSSIDVGIMWDPADNIDGRTLPQFHYLDVENDSSLLKYAEKIIAVAKGTDTDEWGSKINDDATNSSNSTTDEAKNDNGLFVDELVQFRLKKLHLSSIRDLFKEQALMLIKLTPPKEADASSDSEDGHAKAAFDVAAIDEAKATINTRLTDIIRGEASAKFAARHIISLMDNRPSTSRSILTDMQMLALRMIHHSQLSADDIAEALYTTSSTLRSGVKVDPSTCPAVSPWSGMCPPQMFPISGTGSFFPPDFFTQGALRLCKERANAMVGVCSAQQGLEFYDFPTTINQGYFNYYSPKTRNKSEMLNVALSTLTPHFNMPMKLQKLIFETNKLEREINALKEEEDNDGELG